MSKAIENEFPSDLYNPSPELRNLMESMEIYWWKWDVNRKRLELSRKLIDLLGYKAEEFDPSIPTLDRNIHPDDSAENLRLFNSILRGRSDAYEIEFRLKINGRWEWYYNRGSIVRCDEGGLPCLVSGFTMGISKRYNRLFSILNEGSKFDFILKNTKEAVIISTMGKGEDLGRIIEVNAAALNLFACKAEDLIGITSFDLLQDSSFENRNEFRAKLRGEGNLKMDVVAKDFKGNIKHLSVNSHAYVITGEELIVSLLSDNTESQQVRDELKASEVALKQSEEVFRSLIKAADDRIGLFDSEGKVIIVNDAFTEILGYTQEEFILLEDKERIHPEDKSRIEGLKSELFSSGYLSSEYRVQHKDGHYLHMYSKSVLLRESILGRDFILFIIRDVTDQVDFRKELIDAKEKAEEGDKLKSAFLANMSHEIRTPMNSIVGFANLLSDIDTDEESRAEYVRRINRNSEQLLALISDIIDLAKIESNQLSVSYSKVLLENLFNDLTNYGKFLIHEKNKIHVSFQYEPDINDPKLEIESDLVRLTQIMQNLINNAVKFTVEGTITIGYRVSSPNMLRFFVKDTGTGIDSQYFDIIFDQFRQIDGSDIRKFGGTGLGLAICRNLTTLLSGKIWVESEKGAGSTFFVEVPMKSGIQLDNEEVVLKGKLKKKAHIRVLMVDDDHDSLMLFSTMMRSEDIQIITADSGYKALEILEREILPDVILLDLEMPVLNGTQTLRIIRELYPDLKVIAQSAHALQGDREKSMVSGFDDYISKPYYKESILKILSNFSA